MRGGPAGRVHRIWMKPVAVKACPATMVPAHANAATYAAERPATRAPEVPTVP